MLLTILTKPPTLHRPPASPRLPSQATPSHLRATPRWEQCLVGRSPPCKRSNSPSNVASAIHTRHGPRGCCDCAENSVPPIPHPHTPSSPTPCIHTPTTAATPHFPPPPHTHTHTPSSPTPTIPSLVGCSGCSRCRGRKARAVAPHQGVCTASRRLAFHLRCGWRPGCSYRGAGCGCPAPRHAAAAAAG